MSTESIEKLAQNTIVLRQTSYITRCRIRGDISYHPPWRNSALIFSHQCIGFMCIVLPLWWASLFHNKCTVSCLRSVQVTSNIMKHQMCAWCIENHSPCPMALSPDSTSEISHVVDFRYDRSTRIQIKLVIVFCL